MNQDLLLPVFLMYVGGGCLCVYMCEHNLCMLMQKTVTLVVLPFFVISLRQDLSLNLRLVSI